MKKIHKLLSVTISILMIIGVFFAVPITSYAAEDQIADTPPEETANDLTLSEAERKAADTNCDGMINIKDATEIQKYIAGSGTEYKIGELI